MKSPYIDPLKDYCDTLPEKYHVGQRTWNVFPFGQVLECEITGFGYYGIQMRCLTPDYICGGQRTVVYLTPEEAAEAYIAETEKEIAYRQSLIARTRKSLAALREKDGAE